MYADDSLPIARNICLLLLSMVLYLPVFAQEGLDREFRVKAEEVPEAARKFMQAAGFTRKIKWYEEHAVNEMTYEAKSKINKRHYSVEFYPSGSLKDIELRIPFEMILADTRKTLKLRMDSIFTSYRIIETQLQWSRDEVLLLETIHSPESSLPVNTAYELILKGKKESVLKWYELLFDGHGNLLEFDEIPQKSTHHLDF